MWRMAVCFSILFLLHILISESDVYHLPELQDDGGHQYDTENDKNHATGRYGLVDAEAGHHQHQQKHG